MFSIESVSGLFVRMLKDMIFADSQSEDDTELQIEELSQSNTKL